MESMRSNLSRMEMIGRESLDSGVSFEILETAERHREQLSACQRQFRMANVKVKGEYLFHLNESSGVITNIHTHSDLLKLSWADQIIPDWLWQWVTRIQVHVVSEVLRKLTTIRSIWTRDNLNSIWFTENYIWKDLVHAVTLTVEVHGQTLFISKCTEIHGERKPVQVSHGLHHLLLSGGVWVRVVCLQQISIFLLINEILTGSDQVGKPPMLVDGEPTGPGK